MIFWSYNDPKTTARGSKNELFLQNVKNQSTAPRQEPHSCCFNLKNDPKTVVNAESWQPTQEPTGVRCGNCIKSDRKICLVASMWRPRRGILIAPCGSQRSMPHSCTLDAQP